MIYHDYHLAGYSVSDFGGTIVLDLIYDYPNEPKLESKIEFIEVALYHFVHTGGAIISNILPTPVGRLLSDHSAQISEWNRKHSVPGWTDNLNGYEDHLAGLGLSGWTIESSIGFQGFLFAKAVRQKT